MTSHRVALLACLLIATSCGKNSSDVPDAATPDAATDAATDAESDASDVGGLPDRCVTAAGPWTPGTTAFTDATATSNIAGVEGTRISVADFDGDGFPDIFARRVGSVADDFGTSRTTWLLRNRGDGTFEDVTQSSKILNGRTALTRPAEVAAFADVNNDGHLDVVTGFSNDGTNPEGAELMLNNGDGTFTAGPSGLPFRRAGEATSVSGLSWVDIDRDGRLDLWLGQGAVGQTLDSDRLYVQAPNGTFSDVTDSAGVATLGWTLGNLNAGTAHNNTWATAACDLDGDGNPDLLSASYGRAPNKLFHAQGDGKFANVSIASGYAFDERTDWTDNESARCWCKLHPDDDECAGVPAPAIVCNTDSDAFRWNHANDREPFRLGGNSGTTVCGDLNNDGHLDLLTTEIVHWDVGANSDPSEILYNDGATPPKFERPGPEATGLTRTHSAGWNDGDITAALFDFDNDGRLDVYIGSTDYPGTRGLLYHQKPDGTFRAVALVDGIDHKSSHGVAVGDFDRDGDLDLVVGHSRNRCGSGDHCYETAQMRVFRNDFGNRNNWLQLSLEGAGGTNRSAIGARVTVTTPELTQVHEVGGGHGHYGMQNDLVVHAGLGSACTATVTVRWPDKDLTEQTFELQAGYRYQLIQHEPTARPNGP